MNSLIEIKADEFLTIDLKYASEDNITKSIMFKENKCFGHVDMVEKLEIAKRHAAKHNVKLKVFDAYRPQYVQEALWNFCPNPIFVANPARGSNHTKGIAVDLTLCNMDNVELDMGTIFDDFTEKAYHSFLELPENVLLNRKLLLGIMTASGFDFYEKEWWHYQLFNVQNYPLYQFPLLNDTS